MNYTLVYTGAQDMTALFSFVVALKTSQISRHILGIQS